MPQRFETKRQFTTRSDRVKCVDMHETEPWFLATLYSGDVLIYNYETHQLLKQIEVAENTPVRAGKFVCRKQWIVTGSDDYQLRVYNYDTMERVKQIDAHMDYVRSVAVHQTQPYVLSASDDMTIKLWDWEKNWQNTMVFEGHNHYVMQVCFNPKDPNTFASASLDRTVKIWGLNSPSAHFTLEGHTKGVNCIDYYKGADKPYLISGADDDTAKVWDYSSRQCVQTLENHTHNLSAVMFHPDLPIIITASEDNTVKVWHSTTYQIENTLNYGLERCWTLAAKHGTTSIVLGFDEGSVITKIGREEPPVSMDSNGKVIWARQADIQTANLRAATDIVDGEPILLKHKDLESSQLYPQKLTHSPNGRFVTLTGDGEYIIYTAMGWRNILYGSALDFAWSFDSKEYCVRENSGRIAIKVQEKEKTSFSPSHTPQTIFGGHLVAIRYETFVEFRDWKSLKLVRLIELAPTLVLWSDSGDSVAVCSEGSSYVLRFNRDIVDQELENPNLPADGIAGAFDVMFEISDSVKTGCWVGECFIYTTASSRLHYCVGGEVIVLHHLDTPMFLLGYLTKENRVYLMDKDYNVYAYTLLLSMLEFQTQVTRGDVNAAMAVLHQIPEDQHNKCARFLESKGLKDLALEVSKDTDHRFELAVQLAKVDTAYEIASACDSSLHWKQLGDLAISLARMDLAMECMVRADDLAGLLLLLTAVADRENLTKLAQRAAETGKTNVAFVSLLLLGQVEQCLELLIKAERLPEAAFMSVTYMPSRTPEIVQLWKMQLASTNQKAADALANPNEYPNLFDKYLESLERENLLSTMTQTRMPAEVYPTVAESGLLQVLAAFTQETQQSAPAPTQTAPPPQPQPAPQAAQADTASRVVPPSDPVVSGPTAPAPAPAEEIEEEEELEEAAGVGEPPVAVELPGEEAEFEGEGEGEDLLGSADALLDGLDLGDVDADGILNELE